MTGASLRVELFPTSLPVAIDFYTRVLEFKVLRHEPDSPTTGYAHIRRNQIQIGLATKDPNEYPEPARDPEQRKQLRSWPTGVELVIEVDDIGSEWQRVNELKWPVDSGLRLQGKWPDVFAHGDREVHRIERRLTITNRPDWGLFDFRIQDPDGFYLRISERGGEDGRGIPNLLTKKN